MTERGKFFGGVLLVAVVGALLFWLVLSLVNWINPAKTYQLCFIRECFEVSSYRLPEEKPNCIAFKVQAKEEERCGAFWLGSVEGK